MFKIVFGLLFIASAAQAQIGWTIEDCREHWGRETRIELPSEAYVFAGGFQRPIPAQPEDTIQERPIPKIAKRVLIDFDQGKVKDIQYLATADGVADFGNDDTMKALIVGTWNTGDLQDYSSRYITFEADGTLLMGVHNFTMKWDVKDGELIESYDPDADPARREPEPTPDVFYTILFLTNHEFLVREKSASTQAYIFMSR